MVFFNATRVDDGGPKACAFLKFRVQGSGIRVSGLRDLGVKGLGLGCRIYGLGFRV